MTNQRGASKSGALIKMTQALVLLLFVSLLAFSAGAFIGKKISDSEYRRAQLEGEYKGLTAQNEAVEPATEEENLSDDEIASLTEEFVTKAKAVDADEQMAQTPSREVASAETNAGYKKFNAKGAKEPDHAAHEAVKPDHAPHEPVKPDHAQASPKQPTSSVKTPPPAPTAAAPAPSVMAARVADGQAPAPDAKKERKPMSVLPTIASTAVGKYTVQVASYPDENEAKTHASTLKSGGWNAFYVPAEVQGKMWYRVSVGLFTSAKSATEFRKEFQKESKAATAIVQKIVK